MHESWFSDAADDAIVQDAGNAIADTGAEDSEDVPMNHDEYYAIADSYSELRKDVMRMKSEEPQRNMSIAHDDLIRP